MNELVKVREAAAEALGAPAPEAAPLVIGLVGNIVTLALGDKLAAALGRPVALVDHPIDQVFQTLQAAGPEPFLVIHLDHRWFFEVAPTAEAVARAEALAEAVRRRLQACGGAIVLNTVPFLPESLVETDLHDQHRTLSQINQLFFDLARESGRIHVVDAFGVLARLGFDQALRERNRRLLQMPYSPAALEALGRAYARSIETALRPRKKVVAVDADNTLWRGVVGEDGVDGIGCDQEYPGVVHWLFQHQLKRLRNAGVLLAVVTKNNEADFNEAFEKRRFPLAFSDFVAVRSNWNEKSSNLLELAQQLNLGLDSFVFIDDNIFEIEEVRARLPMVECIHFPVDAPERALALLQGLDSLRARSLSAEDLTRSELYRAEAERAELRASSGSLDDYLASLELELHVGVNRFSQIVRVAQLINKTNQFNLTTRRHTEADVDAMMRAGAKVYDFRVVDRFSDMGVVGVVIVRDGVIDTFLMSCRALGRRIETAMLRRVCDDAGGAPLEAVYSPTARNAMVKDFYQANGFALIAEADGVKTYRMQKRPEHAPYLEVVDA